MANDQDWMSNGSCKDRADLFQAAILDFDPSNRHDCQACKSPLSRSNRSWKHTSSNAAASCVTSTRRNGALTERPSLSEYIDLTDEQVSALTVDKSKAENAAVDLCFGCPVMQQCETWSLVNPVSGVSGGYTESQRISVRQRKDMPEPVPTFAGLPTDRGARNQVDDQAIATMSAQGHGSKHIAEVLGCSERSVVRARQRSAAKTAPKPVESQSKNAIDSILLEVGRRISDQAAATTREHGHDSTYIARALGCSERTADRARQRRDNNNTLQVQFPPRTATIKSPLPGTDPCPDKAARQPGPARKAIPEQPAIRENYYSSPAPTRTRVRTIRSFTAASDRNAQHPVVQVSRVRPPMQAMYSLLSDGQWHSREEILVVGSARVDPDTAIKAWMRARTNTIKVDGIRQVRPDRDHVPTSTRIAEGSRLAALNSLEAAFRLRSHLERGGDTGHDIDLYRLHATNQTAVTKANWVTA